MRVDGEIRYGRVGSSSCLVGDEEGRDTRVTRATATEVLGRAEYWSWRESCHEVRHGSTGSFSSHISYGVLQQCCTRHNEQERDWERRRSFLRSEVYGFERKLQTASSAVGPMSGRAGGRTRYLHGPRSNARRRINHLLLHNVLFCFHASLHVLLGGSQRVELVY